MGIPGGKTEDGETPEDFLKRELCEESEIDVLIGEPVGAGACEYRFGMIERMGCTAGPSLPEG